MSNINEPLLNSKNKTPETKIEKISRYVSTFGGVGLLRPAPGTWGSLATLPFAWALMYAGPFVYMGITLALTPLGIACADIYESRKGGHDHSEIVIDEVLGMLVSLTWLPMTWQSFVLAFFLFRLLDIFKPYPIGYLDRKVQGGLGVVVDDLAAGLIANIVLQVIYTKTMWLGVQAVTITTGG